MHVQHSNLEQNGRVTRHTSIHLISGLIWEFLLEKVPLSVKANYLGIELLSSSIEKSKFEFSVKKTLRCLLKCIRILVVGFIFAPIGRTKGYFNLTIWSLTCLAAFPENLSFIKGKTMLNSHEVLFLSAVIKMVDPNIQ